MARLPNELMVRAIAFYRRRVFVTPGIRGEDKEQRAEAVLAELAGPTTSLRYRLTMADLTWSDLMGEDAALLESRWNSKQRCSSCL